MSAPETQPSRRLKRPRNGQEVAVGAMDLSRLRDWLNAGEDDMANNNLTWEARKVITEAASAAVRACLEVEEFSVVKKLFSVAAKTERLPDAFVGLAVRMK